MCQMFSQLPETRVMSEPWAMQHASIVRDNYRGHPWLYDPRNDNIQMSEETFSRLITSVTKLLLKYENKKEVKRVVIKLSVTMGNLVPYIKSAIPAIKCFMMTRHVKVSLESFEKMLRGWGPALTNQKHIVKANNLILNWCPFPYANQKAMIVKQKYINMNKESAIPVIVVRFLLLGASLLNFLQHKHLYTHSVIYEDMMKNTKDELEILYKKLGIPTEFVLYAMKALKFDAQKGTFTQNILVKSNTKEIFTESDWANCDPVFKELGLPISKDMSIEDLRELIKL